MVPKTPGQELGEAFGLSGYKSIRSLFRKSPWLPISGEIVASVNNIPTPDKLCERCTALFDHNANWTLADANTMLSYSEWDIAQKVDMSKVVIYQTLQENHYHAEHGCHLCLIVMDRSWKSFSTNTALAALQYQHGINPDIDRAVSPRDANQGGHLLAFFYARNVDADDANWNMRHLYILIKDGIDRLAVMGDVEMHLIPQRKRCNI